MQALQISLSSQNRLAYNMIGLFDSHLVCIIFFSQYKLRVLLDAVYLYR